MSRGRRSQSNVAECQDKDARLGGTLFRQVNSSANLCELAHEEWDENVKRASVNYFNKLHDLQTTCTKMLVS